ncbi:MAG: signal peptidase II [bacterium]
MDIVLIFAIVVGTLILDQVSKIVVENFIEPGRSVPVVGDLFKLTLRYNTGAAFSIMAGRTPVLLAVSILAIAVIMVMYRKMAQKVWLKVSLSLILGGALGNFLDRLNIVSMIREGHLSWEMLGKGRVVDFLDFGIGSLRWATFNFADSAIVVGVAMLILELLFFGKRTRGKLSAPCQKN